jgi:hypothetical protein
MTKFSVLGPGNRESFDLSFACFPSPVAGCPLQTVQVFAIASRNERCLMHAAQAPLSLLFDVDYAVAVPAWRSAIGRDHFRIPFLNGDIRRRETERLAFDAQLQAFVFCEVLFKSFLDVLTSLQMTAGFVCVIHIRRPEDDERPGIALMQRLEERFAIPLRGRLVLGIAFRLPGPSAISRAVGCYPFDILRALGREKIDADRVAARPDGNQQRNSGRSRESVMDPGSN